MLRMVVLVVLVVVVAVANGPEDEGADVEGPVVGHVGGRGRGPGPEPGPGGVRPAVVVEVAVEVAVEEGEDGARGVDGREGGVARGGCGSGGGRRGGRRRGRRRGRRPLPETVLVLAEQGRGEHLLRKRPRVAADGEEVAQRGVVQGEVRVGDGTGAEERVDALLDVEEVGLGLGFRLLVLLHVLVQFGDRRAACRERRRRGKRRRRRWWWRRSLPTGQPQGQGAEDDAAVHGIAARDVPGRELLERGKQLGLVRGGIGGQRARPLLRRGGLPQLGGAAEQGQQLQGGSGAGLAVTDAPLLLVGGGVDVAQDAGSKEAAARLGVDPAAPAVARRGGVMLVRGEHGVALDGRVLVQGLWVRDKL